MATQSGHSTYSRLPGPAAPAGTRHRRCLSLQPALRPAPLDPYLAGLLRQLAGIGPLPVGVLWVSCRPLRVVNPLAARDGGTSRDGGPRRISDTQPGQPGNTTKETAMHPAQHPQNRQGPARRPETGTPAMTGPALGSADFVHRRHLEKMVSWTGVERLRCLWYRLRLTVAEMNYATRRTVEVQAPWITGDRPAEPAGPGHAALAPGRAAVIRPCDLRAIANATPPDLSQFKINRRRRSS
jgi:hypothetical protein